MEKFGSSQHQPKHIRNLCPCHQLVIIAADALPHKKDQSVDWITQGTQKKNTLIFTIS